VPEALGGEGAGAVAGHPADRNQAGRPRVAS